MTSIFEECTLSAITRDQDQSSLIVSSDNGTWKTSSFYLDSSGRSSVSLPLELRFSSDKALDDFLACTVVDPPLDPEDTDSQSESKKGSLSIESKVALTVGSGSAVSACIEEMTILASKRDGCSLVFETQIIMRVSQSSGEKLDMASAMVKTNLNVYALFSEIVQQEGTVEAEALRLLEKLDLSGTSGLGNTESSSQKMQVSRLKPLPLHVSLTNGFSISVRSIGGSSLGETMVSLTMRHSNSHSEPVTITNIAMHPGHSRLAISDGRQSARELIVDLSKSVQWGFVDGTDPNLPLTLNRFDSTSTIIRVISTDDVYSRTFVSPLSVTAVIGSKTESSRTSQQYAVLAAADAPWTSARAAIESSDAFRVEITTPDDSMVTVGHPFVVALQISNLSDDHRENVVLQLEGSHHEAPGEDKEGEEKGSETLLVDGLGSDAMNYFGSDRLLPMDERILLDTLEPRAVVSKELRFIALEPGTLKIPNLTLRDLTSDKVYHCPHNAQVVSVH